MSICALLTRPARRHCASSLTKIAPVEETSDEESGDIPFSTAPNVPEATDTNGKDEKKGDEDEDEEDEEDEDT